MQRVKSKQMLTKKQISSIGYEQENEIPPLYWNEKVKNCFKAFKCSPRERKNIENQSFYEFKDMTLDGANAEGTGRFRFQDIEKIEFSIILRKDFATNSKASKKEVKNKKINQKQIDNFEETENYKVALKGIEELLSAFFQIEAKHNPTIKLSINENTNKIEDEKGGFEYLLNIGQGSSKERSVYDFWELFDVGMRYKKDYEKENKKNKKSKEKKEKCDEETKEFKNSILLFFIEADLMEGDNPVDGRATGDGIAFVSFKREDFEAIDLESTFLAQEYACYPLPILIHECLHTVGFEHCSAWECLMNSVTNNEFLLCPCCVRKFDDEMSYKIDLKSWYEKLEETVKIIRKNMEEKYGDKKCLRLFADILYSKDELTKNDGKLPKTVENIEIKKMNDKKDYSMLEKCQLIVESFSE